MNYIEEWELLLTMPKKQLDNIPLLEHIIQSADACVDEIISTNARFQLIDEATDVGLYEKALLAFSWLVKRYEEGKSLYGFSTRDILWRYKWIAGTVTYFDAISLEEIEALHEDMKQKLLAGNFSLRPYYVTKMWASIELGKPERASYFFDQWNHSADDILTDCRACEQHLRAGYYLRIEKDPEKSIQAAQVIFDRRMSCRDVPDTTYSILANAYEALDDHQNAWKNFELGYKAVKHTKNIESVAQLIDYLVKTERIELAKSIMKENLDNVLTVGLPYDQLFFLLACSPFLDDEPELQNLTKDLVNRFDQRNGNHYFLTKLQHNN
ncbi:hypothetical protein [Listeria costaricensis]|uniref:hypothetical protein n=1 Tax=Listeria costaricensis TaxID=2026604 RepID=UPI000C081634|nr:hypothetical protein [Listeria costaricensis]